MHTVKHKVEQAFELLSAALHLGKSQHSSFVGRAHALLESALCDMEMMTTDAPPLSVEEVVVLAENWASVEQIRSTKP